MKRALVLSLALIAALAVTAAARPPAAHADYKVGSAHSLMVGRHQLALPLPRTSALPKLTVTPSGRLRVSATMRYRAANWKGHGEAARDRVTVTIAVARKMLATGPYRGSEIFRKAIRHRLSHRRVKRRYSVLLPTRASSLLIKWGALSSQPRRRAQALRRVTVDVQQDRDFRRVDGRYDWREGGAWSAADALLNRLRSPGPSTEGRVDLSSYREPTGTLTLINNTASGVYCQSGCPLAENGIPQSLPGTADQAGYQVPIGVGGGPVQCFDQGSNGSNPEGFANFDAAGEAQPYLPGEVIPGVIPGDELPATTGTAVTEGLAADYTLAWASEGEVADMSGLIGGSVKIGVAVGGALVKSAVKNTISFPSPGTVVVGVLKIFEFFLQNSCKEAGNYFNISGGESQGGTFSQTIETNNENWNDYAGTTDSPYGTQFNPSLLGYQRQPLRLNPVGALTPGLADNACTGCSSNNVVEMSWVNYDPCPSGYNCAAEPPATPIVETGAAGLNCGNANKGCPFPAAGFPSMPKPVFLGLDNGEILSCSATRVTSCSELDDAGANYIASLNYSENKLWAGLSNGIIWECLPEIANECGEVGNGGKHSGVNTVVHENGRAYAGFSDGSLYSCIEATNKGCFTIDSFGSSVNALAIGPGGNLIVGESDGKIYSCSPEASETCSYLDNASSAINTLSQGPGNTFFAGIANGVIWECSAVAEGSCKTIQTAPNPVQAVAYANGRIFAGFGGGGDETASFWGCKVGQEKSCENWGGRLATRFATVGERLYVAGDEYLSLCSTVTAFKCEQLDAVKNHSIDSLAVTGEQFPPSRSAGQREGRRRSGARPAAGRPAPAAARPAGGGSKRRPSSPSSTSWSKWWKRIGSPREQRVARSPCR